MQSVILSQEVVGELQYTLDSDRSKDEKLDLVLYLLRDHSSLLPNLPDSQSEKLKDKIVETFGSDIAGIAKVHWFFSKEMDCKIPLPFAPKGAQEEVSNALINELIKEPKSLLKSISAMCKTFREANVYAKQVVAKTMRKHKLSLEDLGITTAEDVIHFVKQYGSELEYLDVSGIALSQSDIDNLVKYLPKVNTLLMKNCTIGDAGARTIAENLQGLLHLDLGNNLIGVVGAQAIAEHLTSLLHLDLSFNRIGEGGAQAIAEHLTSLLYLDLALNRIGEGGAKAIAEHLTSLLHLDLWNNQIGEGGAKAIAEHLTSLLYLDLRVNQIGEDGARAIAEHLTSLLHLELWDNQIRDVEALKSICKPGVLHI